MRVRLTPAAEFELTDAIAWYDSQAAGLGIRLLDEFKSLTQRLAENPRQFSKVYKESRRASFRSFPYGLFFRIAADEVEVFACLHFSRDPIQWQRQN